jgi:hypothetical protein
MEKGVEYVENNEIDVLSGMLRGMMLSTRPSGPAFLRIPKEEEEKPNRANTAKNTILALLRDAATLTADAADIRRARGRSAAVSESTSIATGESCTSGRVSCLPLTVDDAVPLEGT